MAEEVEMTPITPAEGGSVPPKVSPFGAAPAAKPAAPAAPVAKPVSPAAPVAKPVSPAAPATPAAKPAVLAKPAAPAAPAAKPAAAAVEGAATIKLKPLIRKPMIHKPTIGGPKLMKPVSPAAKPASPAGASPVSKLPTPPLSKPEGVPPTLKRATQNLKSVTGPIPVQATLRKTGIIAEGIITPAQQQAAKSKTSRISLESAIGVAPTTKEGPAPLKTIRLRRPADLKPPAAAPTPAAAPMPAAVETPAVPPAAPASPAVEASETQKKTLKLRRPGTPLGAAKPSLGIKKPSLGIKKPEPAAAPAPAPAEEVADIPDLPVDNIKPLVPETPKAVSSGVPKGVMIMSLLVTFASLLVIGASLYFYWKEAAGPDAGANAMAFIQTES